jgi:hypothetical protein
MPVFSPDVEFTPNAQSKDQMKRHMTARDWAFGGREFYI